MELMFTDDFTSETPYLTSCESFCVSIKFLLNGQVDISTPSDFCGKHYYSHGHICHDAMDNSHCVFHLGNAKELLISLSTQESASPNHQYTRGHTGESAKLLQF